MSNGELDHEETSNNHKRRTILFFFLRGMDVFLKTVNDIGDKTRLWKSFRLKKANG